ncbi:ROK family protein [Microlunatus capsulatus]|uniref:NBD/HSP70 family sugar kinase n=1 Tax=Microlunatus capsulatus TaxID=99117 RepID=A0ABS4Z2C5_9ACTN|nr:ROK family protein [Microlunatus capsulatus]MBP2415201.1 putative NBD/HSP70 family sugar kinase [Microlunatus capsulatus]
MRAAKRRTSREVRTGNRFAVLRAMYALGTPTRQELAGATGLSFATIATMVTELLAVGVVTEASREDSGGGRPRSRLKVAAGRGLLVGVDATETYVHVDVFDLAMTRLVHHDHAVGEGTSDPDRMVGEIAEGVRSALAAAPDGDVLGVGVSLPGQVEPDSGVSLFAPGWGWKDVAAQALLEERLDLPVHVDNPLKATTVAELWFGHGRRVAHLVTVNLGTGIGAGIALDGQLVRGATNNAGEWGHTTLVMDGRPCRCGRDGCLEAYIGVPGLMAQFGERHPGHRYLEGGSQTHFLAAVREGLEADEPEAHELVELFGEQLGVGLANLINMVNPNLVVLTSWAARDLGRWLLPVAEARMRREAINGSAAVVDIVTSAVPTNPVSTGMAAFVLEGFLERVGLPSPTSAPLRRLAEA